MKKQLLIPALLTAASVQASQWQPAVGLGAQYGDLGAKLMYREGNLAGYAAVGLGGAAVGGHYALSSNSPHVFGAMYGFSSDLFDGESMLLATYDYHFNGFSGKGWTLGAGLGVADKKGGQHDGDSTGLLTLSLGYKF